MSRAGRRVALVGLAPDISQSGESRDETQALLDRFPSYGVRRVQAAILADPALADAEVTLHDYRRADPEEIVAALVGLEPDLVGLSAYVWSTPTMVEVARRLRRMRPATTILFGGPSAHVELFSLPPFADAAEWTDGLVVGEGEESFREVVALGDRSRDALARVPGLALPAAGGAWLRTPGRVLNPELDSIASPYQMGLMPEEHASYLETFRGCPLACTFCQWGVQEAKRFFSAPYLARELVAMAASRPLYTYLIDAALNLHPRAFRNLVAAEREVGFFRHGHLLCEVYPTLLRDEHLEFLSAVGAVHVGLGVQSLDPEVLKTSERPFKPERLRGVVEQLLEVGLVDVEIILGLPGDTPESFLRTLDGVLELPCSVRVYRCLVLPDALMTRAPAGAGLEFDPLTLELRSCSTWPERDLRAMQELLSARVETHASGALKGDYWWMFLGDGERYRRAYPTVERALAVATG